MPNVFCAYCGYKTTSVSVLTNLLCPRHPNGPNKGKHILYEGKEKTQYVCKYCGFKTNAISSLTNLLCPRHPNGTNKGKHSPAL